jgi:deazaflavin-dependent oxidoreductase (nitroreductase family)
MVVVGLIDQLGYRIPEANRLQRLVWKVSSSRPGAWLFAKTLHHIDRLALRLSRERVTVPGVLAGLPVITLASTGARSGQRREVPLVGVPSGDQIAVIGTRFGQPRTPGWYSNLRAEPGPRSAIGVGPCRSSPVRPRVMSARPLGRAAATSTPATRHMPAGSITGRSM